MKAKTVMTIILTAVFFVGMTALTLTAREIHNSVLPKVTAQKLTNVNFTFEYTGENGKLYVNSTSASAIKTSLLDGDVYVISERTKNGETRNYATKVCLDLGQEYEEYTEVKAGVDYGQKVIMSTDRELYDGCEVIEVQQEHQTLKENPKDLQRSR